MCCGIADLQNLLFGTLYLLGYLLVPAVQIILYITTPLYISVIIPSLFTTIVGGVALMKMASIWARSDTINYNIDLCPQFSSGVLISPQYYIYISAVWTIFQIGLLFITDSVESASFILIASFVSVAIRFIWYAITYMVIKNRYSVWHSISGYFLFYKRKIGSP